MRVPTFQLTYIAYLLAMVGACVEAPVVYHSRIDGCVLPEEVTP